MTDLDLRIARASTTTYSDVTVGIMSGVFLAANANRVAIVVFPHPTDRYTISDQTPAVLDRGVTPQARADGGPAEHVLRIGDYGDWITGALNAIGAQAMGNITVPVLEVVSTAG